MAFQFSLATVLRVRGIVEEREERLLQKILFELSQTLETLAQNDAEIDGSDASRRSDIFKPLVGHHIHASYGEVEELKQNRNELIGKIYKLKQLRDTQLKIYEAARRNREMLTDMREEKRSAYESDMARSEQKTLDDNYIARRGLN
jgi:flagellar export protein FliJ